MADATPSDNAACSTVVRAGGGLVAFWARVNRLLAVLLALPIRFYRKFISPALPPACRYEPSCSRYALDALQQHGGLRGAWLTTRRLLRCHPFGGSGFDPVPSSAALPPTADSRLGSDLKTR